MYAVIDTETTGLSPKLNHRILEVAVVLVDAAGRVEDQWCTLVNPDRDLGPQHIHGISGADVLSAPRFDDVAGYLAELLAGRVLVAHNLPFDLTFIEAEYDRMGVPFPVTREMGLCTMTLASSYLEGAGRSLRECCAAAGVRLEGWHSAMADATATAGLLGHYLSVCGEPLPWEESIARAADVLWPQLKADCPAPVLRSSSANRESSEETNFLGELADFMPRVDSSDVADPYLAVLDEALADRYLSADENAALGALAISLDLGEAALHRLHKDYLYALARVALADHHLSEAEKADLHRVASILGLPEGAVPAALEAASENRIFHSPNGALPLEPGDLIVFTGDMAEPREVWMQRAAEHGFVPHPSVTKKVRLVVAADPNSLSGKAKKARGYEIPLIGVDEFRRALGYPEPDTHTPSGSAWTNGEHEWAKLLRTEMERS